MKKQCNDFFKRLDFFGVHIIPQIDRDQTIFRSLIGGITTFIVLSASIAYAITIFYKWQMLELTPKIQQSSYISSNSELVDFNYDVIRFYFWNPEKIFIDPFETNVIIPVAVYLNNYKFSYQVALNTSNRGDENKYVVPEIKLGFQLSEDNLKIQQQMLMIFAKCEQYLLPEGQQCASEETVKQFYEQPLNTIMMQINYKTIDPKDKKIKNSIQELVIQVETQTCNTLNSYLQTKLFELNDVFLFGPSSFHELIEGGLFQTQTNSIEYCQQAFGQEVYAVVLIQLSANQTKSVYEYPHASDLFANIGSIISILFLFKYIVLFVNQQSLQKLLEDELIKQYYPQFENIKIVKNFIGKISKVYYHTHCLNETQQKNFIQLHEKIAQKVKIKFSIINMLYEISRLYLMVRSMKSLEEIKKVHLLGIRIPFINNHIFSDSESTSRNFDTSQLNNLLSTEDIGILSLEQKSQMRLKEYNWPEEIDQDFYDLNMIL